MIKKDTFPTHISSSLLRHVDHVPISEPITVVRGMLLKGKSRLSPAFPPQKASSEAHGLLGGEVDAQQVDRIVGVKIRVKDDF